MKGRYLFFTVVTIILPFVLLMNGVMLVFTTEFLQYEYKNPDFPADPFGFSLSERSEYGKECVEYITDFLRKYPDDYLSGLKFRDGSPLFNEREVSHMLDVRVVFQNARAAMAVMIVFIILTGWLVSRKPDSLPGFLRALAGGSLLTLLILCGVAAGIFLGFDAFFDAFHHLFFSGDSWLFYANDTLIRLFPEKLWVDGFTLAAILSGILAFLILLLCIFARQRLNGIKKMRSI